MDAITMFYNATVTTEFAETRADSEVHPPLYEIVLSSVVLGLIILTSILGNVLVLAAIIRERVLHNKTSVFMANLAVADLCNAVFCMTTILVSCIRNEWVFGEIVCGIIGALIIVVCCASINTLGAIALDRYFAIVSPFHYAERMSPRRIALILSWIWIQSVLFSIMPAFGWSQYTYIAKEFICTADWSDDFWYTIVIIAVNIGIPICVMMYCYAHIFRIASAHRKQVNSQMQDSPTCANAKDPDVNGEPVRNRKPVGVFTKRAKQMRRDTKAATTLLVVMGTFLICWLPHCITMLCLAIPSCTAIPDAFYVVSTWFAMFNSACNPFIYCITNRQLRNAFQRTVVRLLPEACRRRMDVRVNPVDVTVANVTVTQCAHAQEVESDIVNGGNIVTLSHRMRSAGSLNEGPLSLNISGRDREKRQEEKK